MIKVVCAIAINDGKLLIGKRSENKKYGGFWELIGGKVESGESEEEALKRELKEELGVDSMVHSKFMSHIHRYDENAIELIAYFIDLKREPKESNSHSELAWLNIDQLPIKTFLEADIPIISEIRNFYSHISQDLNRLNYSQILRYGKALQILFRLESLTKFDQITDLRKSLEYLSVEVKSLQIGIDFNPNQADLTRRYLNSLQFIYRPELCRFRLSGSFLEYQSEMGGHIDLDDHYQLFKRIVNWDNEESEAYEILDKLEEYVSILKNIIFCSLTMNSFLEFNEMRDSQTNS